MADPSCGIIASTPSDTCKMVNIVTAKTGTIKTYAQVPAATVPRFFRIFRASGGTVAGLKTICIAGYSGPA
jgi:hypothetical protein